MTSFSIAGVRVSLMLVRRGSLLALLVPIAAFSTSCGTSSEGEAGPGGDGAAPGGAQEIGWKSGSRLRARLATAGSARLFVGWHDTALAIDCNYAVASDGTMRCLPEYNVSSFYDDSECKNPVGVVAKDTPTPMYLPA